MLEEVRLDGKTAIITGANSGIGKATAHQLAKRGCKIILACRNEDKALKAIDDLQCDPDIDKDQLVYFNLRLDSLDSIKEFVNKFCECEEHLHILVNNAATITKHRKQTLDGFEMTMAVNYVGHFYLTTLLMEKLKASSPSRIVNVSSKAYSSNGQLDFDDFHLTRNWKSSTAYARSKTALLLFTIGLTFELKNTGVTSYAVLPGRVKTNLYQNISGCGKCVTSCSDCCTASAEKGAQNVVYCCVAPGLEDKSGELFSKKKVVGVKPYASDKVIAKKLWLATRDMLGLENTD